MRLLTLSKQALLVKFQVSGNEHWKACERMELSIHATIRNSSAQTTSWNGLLGVMSLINDSTANLVKQRDAKYRKLAAYSSFSITLTELLSTEELGFPNPLTV
jgi:hypothetical protein